MRHWILFLFLTLGSLTAAQPNSERPLLAQPNQQARLQRVGAALAARTGHPNWSFQLIPDPLPFAAMPGDWRIEVSQGLLDLQLDDAELAGVMAHEMAHGLHQDTVSQRVEPGALETLNSEVANLQAEQAKLRGQSTHPWAAVRLGELERTALLLRTRQQQLQELSEQDRQANHTLEMDADRSGRELAVRAGFQADGLERALTKLLALCPAELTCESATHPALFTRIQALRKLAD